MLQQRASQISLMNFEKIPRDPAGFGSTVELREFGGERVTYHLVMPEDADPDKGWISTASPIGRAVVGKEEGDELEAPTPTGIRKFELLKLTTVHDG